MSNQYIPAGLQRFRTGTYLTWLLAALSVLFLVGRLHYFFLPEYDLLRQTYDARWWWGFQQLIERPDFTENPAFPPCLRSIHPFAKGEKKAPPFV